MIRHMLLEGGYAVLEVENSFEVARVVEEHKAPIALLLTDLMMPGMNGVELADFLLTLRPGMKVLYMSGYDDAIIQHFPLQVGSAFLQKPFLWEELAGKIQELLGQSGLQPLQPSSPYRKRSP